MNQYPNGPQPPYQQPPVGYQSNPGYPPPPSPNGYTQYPPQGQPGYPPQGYPQQPMPPQQEAKKKKLPIFKIGCGSIIALVVLGIIIGVANGGKSNAGTDTTSSSTTSNTTNNSSAAPQHFKVGDTVKVGDTWQVVVNSAKTDNGGEISTLKSGDVYLVVDVSLKNLSNQEQNVSSIVQFTLQDATTGKKYDESIDTNAGASLDGKVSAGSPLEGVIAFEVPANAKNFTFNFAPDAFGSGQTTWDLSV